MEGFKKSDDSDSNKTSEEIKAEGEGVLDQVDSTGSKLNEENQDIKENYQENSMITL
jgi:hypothetical protein